MSRPQSLYLSFEAFNFQFTIMAETIIIYIIIGLTRCHSERSPDSHRDELREVKNLSIYLRTSHMREILR